MRPHPVPWQRSEQLRMAVALAHSVTGAELELTCTAGDPIVVSQHPAADLTPCALRSILMQPAQPPGSLSARIAAVQVRGSLGHLGGGVYGTRTLCGLHQRWLATTLHGRPTLDVLDEVAASSDDDGVIQVTVTPDPGLGVTLIGASVADRSATGHLDRFAGDTAGALLAQELIAESVAAGLLRTPDEGPASARPRRGRNVSG